MRGKKRLERKERRALYSIYLRKFLSSLYRALMSANSEIMIKQIRQLKDKIETTYYFYHTEIECRAAVWRVLFSLHCSLYPTLSIFPDWLKSSVAKARERETERQIGWNLHTSTSHPRSSSQFLCLSKILIILMDLAKNKKSICKDHLVNTSTK